ncbi:MAG: DEAD/DEAH box helicase [Deltaproteobacteria bacterium]|nr:DEAD/DEAH box helicase [Deltaproteobacteria bacterium]
MPEVGWAIPRDIADIELDFYERFFFESNLEPYPVQEQAFSHIFVGESIMVTVPTGTGKTMMAKAGIFRALELGKTAIYTTPLRALTEEKYRELCADFGEERVGFATGDYQINPGAPVQVLVAEILWNRIFGDRVNAPADIVIMDEGHYFNDFERGYVWEQSIIGLDPRTQLVVLSATVGHPEKFCHWVELTRRIPMKLVDSRVRRIPLEHRYREDYLIDVVKDLARDGEVPAIIFVFGREKCFETARLLKSCPRFTTDEERQLIEEACHSVLHGAGVSDELRKLLIHGIGVHHAGLLPRYKQLVEKLTLDRLLRFVVSTETISAGINLPAKRVVFPSLRKYIRRQARLVTPAEYHQMAGRAGRPQFDSEGVAIALAPEEVVQELRKEIKTAKKKGYKVDEEKLRKTVVARARASAARRDDVIWDQPAHAKLIQGQPAELRSRTRVTAEQVLAIGLPDLTRTILAGANSDDDDTDPPTLTSTDFGRDEPPYMNLNIATVVDNLLLSDKARRGAQKLLAQVTDNLKALGVIDEHGVQVTGKMIGELQGLDGLFLYFLFMNYQLDYEQSVELAEFLVDHDVIHKRLMRKELDKRKEWIRAKLREMRAESPQASWEDAEEAYEREHPRELTRAEVVFSEFQNAVPHPQLHGGKQHKEVWARIETEDLSFFEFVERYDLEHEEGSLFSYLSRVMKVGKAIHEAVGLPEFGVLESRVRDYLAKVDPRVAKQS